MLAGGIERRTATARQQTLHRQLTPRIADLTDCGDSEGREISPCLSHATDSMPYRNSADYTGRVRRSADADRARLPRGPH